MNILINYLSKLILPNNFKIKNLVVCLYDWMYFYFVQLNRWLNILYLSSLELMFIKNEIFYTTNPPNQQIITL